MFLIKLLLLILPINGFLYNTQLKSYNKPIMWHPESWKSKKQYQIPTYSNRTELEVAQHKLRYYAPLVFAGECDSLKHDIAKVTCGKAFLLIGGDCAESFDDSSVNTIRDTFKLLLQMSLILTYGSSLPVVKVGRMAGQFAKPRSNLYETIDNVTLPVYRGDIINNIAFTEEARQPDPNRLLTAYHISSQTLNILRAFSSGGLADLNNIELWNLNFLMKYKELEPYKHLTNMIKKTIKFIQAIGINTENPIFKSIKFYTAHECLLLPYEECLTRRDSISKNWYDCSAHFLWIGERTRQLDSAHVEFIRGINNPIGIKISSNFNATEIIELIKIINPKNELGRVTIITRMGPKKLKEKLPELINIIKNNSFNVAWCCDPVHGNTIEVINNSTDNSSGTKIKTRLFKNIMEEINVFFDIHKNMGTFPGGIHLELTGLDVTECIGGYLQDIKETDLINNYISNCDPRLNGVQALEIAMLLANKLSD